MQTGSQRSSTKLAMKVRGQGRDWWEVHFGVREVRRFRVWWGVQGREDHSVIHGWTAGH